MTKGGMAGSGRRASEMSPGVLLYCAHTDGDHDGGGRARVGVAVAQCAFVAFFLLFVFLFSFFFYPLFLGVVLSRLVVARQSVWWNSTVREEGVAGDKGNGMGCSG